MLRIMGWGLTGCSKRMSVPIICPLAPGRADRDWTLDQQRVFGTLFQIYADLARDESAFDRLFEDGDRFGDLKAIVLHVPGHTALDLAYVIGNAAFVGDTIFMPDCGTARADFPGGNPRKLYRSIRRLLTCPSIRSCSSATITKRPGARPSPGRRPSSTIGDATSMSVTAWT